MTPERNEFDALFRSTAAPARLPPGLADRITAAAVRDFRYRRNVRRAGWATATCGILLVAGWLAWPAPRIAPHDSNMARMIDPFREADSAFASLSRSAADRVTSTAPVLPASVDILPDPQIRQELSALTDWPTIPQVFVKGELIGGADITEELYASGDLGRKLDEALGAERDQVVKTVVVGAGAGV